MMGGESRLLGAVFSLIWICLAASVGAQLQCHPETLTYSYTNEIRLWGAAEQKLMVTCQLDLDCHGVSDLSNSSRTAFDYVIHVYNVTVIERQVDPRKAAKLCKGTAESCIVGEGIPGDGDGADPGDVEEVTAGNLTQFTLPVRFTQTAGDGADPGDVEEVTAGNLTQFTQPVRFTQTAGGGADPGDVEEVTAGNLTQFSLPVRFTQTAGGAVIRVQFMEEDLEHDDVVNLKKGIISAMQTKVMSKGETTERETDSIGSHNTHYRARQEGLEVQVEKDFTTDEDESPRAKITRMASVQVTSRTLVKHGEIEETQGEITTKLDDNQFEADEADVSPSINVEELLHSHTWFELKLLRKSPRSASRQKRLAGYGHLMFLDRSLQIEDSGDDLESKYEKLWEIYEEVDLAQIGRIIMAFATSGDEQHLEILKTGLMLESEIGIERVQRRFDLQRTTLIDSLVHATYQVMSECHTQWTTCRGILELYTLGGGRRVEEVFEFLLSTESTLDTEQQVEVTNLLSFLERPSDRLVLALVHTITQLPETSDTFSATLLTLGSLAGQNSVNEHTKSIVRSILLKELESVSTADCTEDVRISDALEAIGNMGDVRLVDRLMEVYSACAQSRLIRVALLHSTRQMLADGRVLGLMVDTLQAAECEVSADLVNMLIETLQEQQLDEALWGDWPLSGFNQFDHVLASLLLEATEKLACVRPDAVRYFEMKLSPESRNVSRLLALSESDSLYHHTITKRGIKKHSSCSKWSDFKGRYKAIASANTFKAESKKYNRRKSCLAHFGIGPKKANINLYCAYFAGYRTPASSFQKRVFAKAVAKGKVFKKSFSLATVYFYAQTNGPGNAKGRVYAKAGKKTFINKSFSKKFKSSNKLYSGPSIKIRVAQIPVYITKINIDLKLSASVVLTTDFKPCGKSDLCLTFTPAARAKATASASVNLAAVRAGANVNVNLNYYVRGTARARTSKSPCIRLSHGRNKNSVNLEFYYQVRSKVKVKVKLWPPKFKVKFKWGKKKTWKPSSLKWTIGKSKDSKIYSNC